MKKFTSVFLIIVFTILIFASFASPQIARDATNRITLLGSTTVTSGPTVTNGSAVTRMQEYTQGLMVLSVTANPSGSNRTLQVWVQTTADGSNWHDVVAFTAVTGNAGASAGSGGVYSAPWSSICGAALAPAILVNATTAASTTNCIPLGDQVRVTYKPSDSQSWTFSVTGFFRRMTTR